MTSTSVERIRKERGLCAGCGKAKPIKGSIRCLPCLARKRAYKRTWERGKPWTRGGPGRKPAELRATGIEMVNGALVSVYPEDTEPRGVSGMLDRREVAHRQRDAPEWFERVHKVFHDQAEACRRAPGPCTCGIHITGLGDWPTLPEQLRSRIEKSMVPEGQQPKWPVWIVRGRERYGLK